jgi:hypothetical protein
MNRAVLITMIGILGGALSIFAQGTQPVTVTFPVAGSTVSSEDLTISLAVSAVVDPATVVVNLDQQDVSAAFYGIGSCPTSVCTETGTFAPETGLTAGPHTLAVGVAGAVAQQITFTWQPTAAPVATLGVRLPPIVALSTVGPGGRQPWISISVNSLDGGTTYYPNASSVPSTGCSGTYEILVLDRRTLQPMVYFCESGTAGLKIDLDGATPDQIVIVGTNYLQNATANLDTTGIGGTSYPNAPSIMQGYMIIGVGGAAPGTASEIYNTADECCGPWNAQLNGVLALDPDGNYNFHPSDNTPFAVQRASGSATITLGSKKYTPPTSSAGLNGFWLLKVQRSILSVDTSTGCASTDGGTTWTNCGVFYETGSTTPATSAAAISSLATALTTNLTSRYLVFLVSTGAGPAFPSTVAVNSLGPAIDGLGGSGYTLTKLGAGSAYTLISSNDPQFLKTPLQGGNAVLSTTAYSSLNQTGSVYGVLSRNLQGLYRPVDAVQGNVTDSNATDLTMFQLAWSQPAPWPMMDTVGRVSAYRYLSNQIINMQLHGATIYLDDIRGWYTNALNTTIAAGKDKVMTVPYPPNGQWTFNGTTYTFSAADLLAEQTQITMELGYLGQSIPYLGNAATGTGLGGAIAGSSSGATFALISAAATTAADLKAAASTPVRINGTAFMDLITALSPLPGLSTLGPLVGVYQGMMWAGDIAGSPDGSGGIPSPEYTLLTTVANLAQAQNTYIIRSQLNYNTVLNNIYSDWAKLSTVGANVVGKWVITDQTTWNRFLPASTNASNVYFNLQIGGALYRTDLQKVGSNINQPWLIGSWKWIPTYNPNSRPFWLCTAVYANPGPGNNWAVYPSTTVVNSNDLIYIGSRLVYNNTESMKVEAPSASYLLKLSATTANNGFALPMDLLLAQTGPFPRREGDRPNYGGGACPTVGAFKY